MQNQKLQDLQYFDPSTSKALSMVLSTKQRIHSSTSKALSMVLSTKRHIHISTSKALSMVLSTKRHIHNSTSKALSSLLRTKYFRPNNCTSLCCGRLYSINVVISLLASAGCSLLNLILIRLNFFHCSRNTILLKLSDGYRKPTDV